MKTLCTCLLLGLAAALAQAKLPPVSPEAQAKADEAKAKTAWTDKVGTYKLCLAMDRVAANYRKGAGASAPEPVATAPCADPGPYVAAAAASSAKPLEASGAHSPPETATAPPGSQATQAQQQGHKKAAP